jgi:hypothetical protein
MQTSYRELSNGHFSDDNQKRLTGTNIPVPIYEAKMTRDSRLVVGEVLSFSDLPSDRKDSIRLTVFRTMIVK